MVTTIYLVRHGETEGSEERRYKGTIDVSLSEKGIRQMERVSRYIVEVTKNRSNPSIPPLVKGDEGGLLDAVYCSDLSRAVQSAEIIAEPFRLSPVKINDLRERDFGKWEGMSFDEIREQHPEEFNAWAGNPLEFSPMNGESTLEVRERSIKVFDRISGNHDGEDIAIVAHGGINRIIICHLLGVPLENLFRIEQDYGALNIIEFHERYPVIRLINYRAFDYG